MSRRNTTSCRVNVSSTNFSCSSERVSAPFSGISTVFSLRLARSRLAKIGQLCNLYCTNVYQWKRIEYIPSATQACHTHPTISKPVGSCHRPSRPSPTSLIEQLVAGCFQLLEPLHVTFSLRMHNTITPLSLQISHRHLTTFLIPFRGL